MKFCAWNLRFGFLFDFLKLVASFKAIEVFGMSEMIECSLIVSHCKKVNGFEDERWFT
jgi:hypothetical protein